MDYLVYVEHSAENLQFYLWYKDYVRRFHLLSANDKRLSPEWKQDTSEVPNLTRDPAKLVRIKPQSGTIATMMESGYDAKESTLFGDGQITHISARPISMVKDSGSTVTSSIMDSLMTTPSTADGAAQAGLKWKPCTTAYPSTS
jgi:hypothetical protein